MPSLARNAQSGECGAEAFCKGEDLLVVLVGLDETSVAKAMTEKLKVAELVEAYGDEAPLYLWNKNVHSLPRRCTGGIVTGSCGCGGRPSSWCNGICYGVASKDTIWEQVGC